MRTPATRFSASTDLPVAREDLDYGDVFELSQLLEEVSKLLEVYSYAILNSDS